MHHVSSQIEIMGLGNRPVHPTCCRYVFALRVISVRRVGYAHGGSCVIAKTWGSYTAPSKFLLAEVIIQRLYISQHENRAWPCFECFLS
jgi:hypothetical protein